MLRTDRHKESLGSKFLIFINIFDRFFRRSPVVFYLPFDENAWDQAEFWICYAVFNSLQNGKKILKKFSYLRGVRGSTLMTSVCVSLNQTCYFTLISYTEFYSPLKTTCLNDQLTFVFSYPSCPSTRNTRKAISDPVTDIQTGTMNAFPHDHTTTFHSSSQGHSPGRRLDNSRHLIFLETDSKAKLNMCRR